MKNQYKQTMNWLLISSVNASLGMINTGCAIDGNHKIINGAIAALCFASSIVCAYDAYKTFQKEKIIQNQR